MFRSEKQLDFIQQDMKLLKESGIEHSLFDVEQCLSIEPGLADVKDKLVGGLYLPHDETGDCHQFCLTLTEKAKQLGVQFLFDTEVVRLNHKHQTIESITTTQGRLKADAYVVASGSYSRDLLRQVDLSIPVYPGLSSQRLFTNTTDR